MTLKQISLFLENQPGALSRPVRLLADAKINLLTLSIADAQQFGILRLIVHDWRAAKKLLESEGFVVKVTDMVAIEVADEPGGLAEILTVLERAKINLEYMYAFTVKQTNKGVLVFRFGDPDAAVKALKKKGISVVGSGDLAKRLGH